MHEYYPWRSELDIFTTHANSIVENHLSPDGAALSIIELGAGDGAKTGKLLDTLERSNIIFEYIPIDISAGAMDSLFTKLALTHPAIDAHGIVATYMDGLQHALNRHPERRAVVLFLGSTIGNFTLSEANNFTHGIQAHLRTGDIFYCGWDLKKEPSLLHAAYNDTVGITGLFYLNVLSRANRELNADFRVKDFSYHGAYDPVQGCMQLYLLANRPCRVRLRSEGEKIDIDFECYEPIFVNRSTKFSVNEAHEILVQAGFDAVSNFFDSDHRFVGTIAKKL